MRWPRLPPIPLARVRSFPDERSLRLLIVGDSVAQSLKGDNVIERYELDAFGEVEVMNIGGIACSVIHEGVWWLGDGTNLVDNPGCDGPERYDQVIADWQPDVVLTLFGWPGVGAGQQLDDGSVVKPCEPGFDERWLRDYRAMVERIDRSAVAVVSSVAPPSLPRAEQGPGTRCLNALVDQVDAPQFDYPGVVVPRVRLRLVDAANRRRPLPQHGSAAARRDGGDHPAGRHRGRILTEAPRR